MKKKELTRINGERNVTTKSIKGNYTMTGSLHNFFEPIRGEIKRTKLASVID
jgi:hypothetical protein